MAPSLLSFILLHCLAASEIQIVLRIWTILATAAAMFLMVTSKQSTMVYGIPLQAQYNYATAFKFFVYANGIARGLSVLSLIVALALYRRDTRASHCFFLATFDLFLSLTMSLVMAGFAAAAAVGYIGKYGERHIGWMSICDNVAIYISRCLIHRLPIAEGDRYYVGIPIVDYLGDSLDSN